MYFDDLGRSNFHVFHVCDFKCALCSDSRYFYNPLKIKWCQKFNNTIQYVIRWNAWFSAFHVIISTYDIMFESAHRTCDSCETQLRVEIRTEPNWKELQNESWRNYFYQIKYTIFCASMLNALGMFSIFVRVQTSRTFISLFAQWNEIIYHVSTFHQISLLRLQWAEPTW